MALDFEIRVILSFLCIFLLGKVLFQWQSVSLFFDFSFINCFMIFDNPADSDLFRVGSFTICLA
jgi:hypothetical protein